MRDKICRVCWNTSGWQRPTGDAVETGRAHVAQYRFGLEEWLFNYEWMIRGYRYGFLQPINKFYGAYSGKSCSVLLYTFTPEAACLLVGKINELYVPELDEIQETYNAFEANGWLDEMRDMVDSIDGNANILDTILPTGVLNVRFRPEDVEIFDPRPQVTGKHKIIDPPKFYHPYNWDKNDEPNVAPSRLSLDDDDPDFDEKTRTRAAQKATKYDPKHVKIQNRLFRYLRNQLGAENVLREEQYVDLTVRQPDGSIFYEIKSDETAKKCIRSALGQLLEYAHYPEDNRANRLVVVGDPVPTDEDISYITFLRNNYFLEIYYAQFLWETDSLSDEI